MKNTIKAVLLGGAAAAVIAAALSGAGSANASCASLNGHNIGQGCMSTPGSVSVGLGRDAQADLGGAWQRRRRRRQSRPQPFYDRTTSRPWRMRTGPATPPSRSATAATGGHAGHPQHASWWDSGSNAFSYGGNVANGLFGLRAATAPR